MPAGQTILTSLITLALVAACSDSPTVTSSPIPTSSPAATSRPASTGPRVVSSGLQVPWGLAFLPDGSALVGERDTATVHRISPGGRRVTIGAVPGVQPGGEGGLLGLAVARTFARDGWVYAYFTSATDNRVVRFQLAAPTRLQVLLSGIPKAGNHNGGRLAFGPDGMLYVGTGDAGDGSRSQDRTSLAGKILRISPTGGAAPGNPFGTPIWSLGHRNVQGLAFDAQGRLWADEFGQKTFDEVNLIVPGGNFGWPEVEGKDTGGGRFIAPQVTWRTSDASPSGVAYANGALYVAALRGQRLFRVPVSGGRAGAPTQNYEGTYGRLRSVAVEPGGAALWVTTSNCDGRGDCGSSKDAVLRVPL